MKNKRRLHFYLVIRNHKPVYFHLGCIILTRRKSYTFIYCLRVKGV